MWQEKNRALNAMLFAMEAHKEQKRKYTNNPYFTHLAEVAGLLSTVRKDQDSLATAWLHDCIEDCNVAAFEIASMFGNKVSKGVELLSDMEKGNRSERKRLSRERLRDAPGWVQDIKVCDLISNTSSIAIHDPNFAVLYIEEKRLMLEVLKKANQNLLDIAFNIIEEEKMTFKELPDGTTQYLDENDNLVGEATSEELERWKEHPMHDHVEKVVPTHAPISKRMTVREVMEEIKDYPDFEVHLIRVFGNYEKNVLEEHMSICHPSIYLSSKDGGPKSNQTDALMFRVDKKGER